MTSQTMLPASPLRPRYLIMALIAVIVIIVAIIRPSDWFLNWVHVMFGTLWTGIDLFMGFVVGPVLRTLPLETRRAVLNELIPRTLVLMPTLSIVTGTARLVSRQAARLSRDWLSGILLGGGRARDPHGTHLARA